MPLFDNMGPNLSYHFNIQIMQNQQFYTTTLCHHHLPPSSTSVVVPFVQASVRSYVSLFSVVIEFVGMLHSSSVSEIWELPAASFFDCEVVHLSMFSSPNYWVLTWVSNEEQFLNLAGLIMLFYHRMGAESSKSGCLTVSVISETPSVSGPGR